MRFREMVINFQSLGYGLHLLRIKFSPRNIGVFTHEAVTVSQTSPGKRIVGILLQGFFKIADGSIQAFLISFVPEKATLQVKLVSFTVFCKPLLQGLSFLVTKLHS